MKRMYTMTQDEIFNIIVGITSDQYLEDCCESCPMHEHYNPVCNDDNMSCLQSLVYYLSEDIDV